MSEYLTVNVNESVLNELNALRVPLQQSIIIMLEDAINLNELVVVEGHKVRKTFRIRPKVRFKLKAIAKENGLSISEALSFLLHGYYLKRAPQVEGLQAHLQEIIVKLKEMHEELDTINTTLGLYDSANHNIDRARNLLGKEAQVLLRWLDSLQPNIEVFTE